MVTLKLRRPRSRREKEPQTMVVAPVTSPLELSLDVLNRDQRTIVTINRNAGRATAKFEKCCESFRRDPFRPSRPVRERQTHVDLFGLSETDSTIDRFIKKIKSRSWTSHKKFHHLITRLGEVFIVGVCLLTIVRVPVAMSAPSTRHAKTTEHSHRALHTHRLSEDSDSYMHPCGKSREEEMNNAFEHAASRASDPDILNRIILSTQNVLSYTRTFKDSYVEKTFNLPFEQHHTEMAKMMYDWLPNESNVIPKSLGSKVNPTHLKSKTFDEFLINIYEYMQKFAVGLEQIVLDQWSSHGEFRHQFEKTEVLLKVALCQIREAMFERNITVRVQVPRSIMVEEIRQLKTPSKRNLRDWFIFRDLMNGLEYAIEVFEHILVRVLELSADTSS